MGVQARRPPAQRVRHGYSRARRTMLFSGLFKAFVPARGALPGAYRSFSPIFPRIRRDSATESRKVDDRPVDRRRPTGQSTAGNPEAKASTSPRLGRGPGARKTGPEELLEGPNAARGYAGTGDGGAWGEGGAYFLRYFCLKEEKEAFRPRKYAARHNRPLVPTLRTCFPGGQKFLSGTRGCGTVSFSVG